MLLSTQSLLPVCSMIEILSPLQITHTFKALWLSVICPSVCTHTITLNHNIYGHAPQSMFSTAQMLFLLRHVFPSHIHTHKRFPLFSLIWTRSIVPSLFVGDYKRWTNSSDVENTCFIQPLPRVTSLSSHHHTITLLMWKDDKLLSTYSRNVSKKNLI